MMMILEVLILGFQEAMYQKVDLLLELEIVTIRVVQVVLLVRRVQQINNRLEVVERIK